MEDRDTDMSFSIHEILSLIELQQDWGNVIQRGNCALSSGFSANVLQIHDFYQTGYLSETIRECHS